MVPMDPALIGMPLLHNVGSPTTLNGQTAFIMAVLPFAYPMIFPGSIFLQQILQNGSTSSSPVFI